MGGTTGRSFSQEDRGKTIEHAILTDKGGEFVNSVIDLWYQSQGIEHIKIGPKSSHMNPVERQQQSLGNMAKTMLRHAALPKMFWPDAI